MRNKVQGMFLGVAIGDSLGMPVETWGRERILQQYPNGIQRYETPDGHKWFAGEESGTVTDDTQLTLAVIKGIIQGNGFDLDAIAHQHVNAMSDSVAGWGKTTQETIRRLANGVSWRESGKLESEGNRLYGVGNGVPMKISPLAAWRVSTDEDLNCFDDKIVAFSAMTHYTQLSAHAALAHTYALIDCLVHTPKEYDIKGFFDTINIAFMSNVDYLKEGDSLKLRFQLLRNLWHEKGEDLSFEEIANTFKGTCYVADSLPYVYAHWLKNHKDVNVLYDSINYGVDRNDTDSNASMLGAMLGALHGVEIFEKEQHLIDGLKDYDEIMKWANLFCDNFGIG